MARPTRMLIYTQDSHGLGHLRRCTNLANALVAAEPNLTVLLAVDSPVAPFFRLGPRVDFVKLPTLIKQQAGQFVPGRLATQYEQVHALRTTLLLNLADHFAPDLLLVDHMPAGANRELLPALEHLRSAGRARMAIGLRDLIDAPEVVHHLWKREDVYATLARYYERILIYGDERVFPTARAYRLDGELADRARYCGYVVRPDPVRDAGRKRSQVAGPGQKLVVVTAGGGADAFRLLSACAEAGRDLLRQERAAMLLVTGPFLPAPQAAQVRQAAERSGVRVRSRVSDALRWLAAADAVVTMAGYNTLCEVLRLEKPLVVVPRPGPSAEQTMRAGLLAERGLAQVVPMPELSPARLVEALSTALASDPANRLPVPLTGLAQAVSHLRAMLPADR